MVTPRILGKPSNTVNFMMDPTPSSSSIEFEGDQLIQIGDLSRDVQLLNRIDLKALGYNVEALNRKQQLNHRRTTEHSVNNDFSNDAVEQGGENPGLEAHPELPFMGGKADQLFIPGAEDDPSLYQFLSEEQKSSIEASKKRKAELLKNQQKQKQALKNKYTIRNAPKSQPKLQQQYTYRRPPPRPTPY